MMGQLEWLKKKGLVSRLVFISVMLTAMLLHTADVYGASSVSQLSGGIASAGTAALNDIGSHWAKQAIETAVAKGYVKGYPDGTFKPNKEVSRAEFVKMVADSLHLPVTSVTAGTKWYMPYVSALKAAALLQDSDMGAGWDGQMNRTEMSKLLVRGTDDEVRGKKLTDGEALYKSASAGLIGGIADGTLNEKGTTTRAEAVAVIERLSTVRVGGKLTPDKNAVQNAAIIYKGTNLEEVWGTKPVTLPFKLDIDDKAEVTMDKMIVVDLDDPKAPLRSKFKELQRQPDTKVMRKDAYAVAMHIVVKNTKIQGKNRYNFLADKVTTNSDRGQYVAYDVGNQTDFPVVPPFWLDTVTTVNGWHIIVVEKSVLQKHPDWKIPFLITYTGLVYRLGTLNGEGA
ncbi:S-layer homology domain-containing protein [Cohnella sp. OV330]|uniref:S-layer homology domain-containing protein n=1 Tax=Cohnella sp. OV330 TaxID=1855288 RepID=UPI0008E3DCFD|nr:S-layer homology domain-containing protein [Cohnella sp. OV330]SFA93612.1 S-layer homology domain-containing protein [Cohnella sp. OV330]